MATNKDEVSALLEKVQKQGEAYKNGEQGGREALRDSCMQLQSALIPPAENFIIQTWVQPAHLAALRFAGEIHLFEALAADNGSPKTSKVVADGTNPKTEHTLVARMLRLFASQGTIKETDKDTFAPTALAKAMTQDNFQEAVEFMHDDFNPCLTKETAFFRENEYKAPSSGLWAPFQYFYDCKDVDLFAYFAKVPGFGKRFGSVMNVWSTDRPKLTQEGYYPVKERLIDGADSETFLVDIGGGTGHDISELKQTFGDAIPGKLILEDRPEVIAVAEKGTGLEGIEKMGHDFLTEQPVKGTSVLTLLLLLYTNTFSPRRTSILPPLHHARLERRSLQTDPQLHQTCHEGWLLQDPHQRLHRTEQGRTLAAD